MHVNTIATPRTGQQDTNSGYPSGRPGRTGRQNVIGRWPAKKARSTAGYAHLADAHLVEAAETFSAIIAAAMAGGSAAGP
ncbi:MAG: hypothetical protein OXL68_16710 [Paracoccaceae bacterium]|nr:hypothetical protein [Paracoccaceae bacterium]